MSIDRYLQAVKEALGSKVCGPISLDWLLHAYAIVEGDICQVWNDAPLGEESVEVGVQVVLDFIHSCAAVS